MFDKKKLEAFLDGLEVETHLPEIEKPRSELDRKMDKYDLFKQGDYQNFGTSEYPIWGKQDPRTALNNSMYMYQNGMFPSFSGGAYYGGIKRAVSPFLNPFRLGDEATEVKSAPSPYDELKHKIRQLKVATPAKITDSAPAPKQPDRSPDYVHTLTAWRGWDVEDGRLAALGCDYEWEEKRARRATCGIGKHPAPQMKCGCGFWSFKTLDLLTQAMANYTVDVKVIGTVEIWGRVIECENGFRSEYAYPKELWLLEDGLESLSWEYGVPVRTLEKERAK
jgi:hypothetical protein